MVADRPGAGAVAKGSTSGLAGYRIRGTLVWLERLKPESPTPVTHFLQQGHTSSRKASLLIVPLPMSLWASFSFKPLQVVKVQRLKMR